MRNLEINDQFKRALDVIEAGKHVFLTGKAGTGKSTLLEYFRSRTRKQTAVLAPTGVAAVNVRGQTIHSFFRFKPDITPDTVKDIKLRNDRRKLYKKVDAVVIDEVSMLRADLLDCVDRFLRLHGKMSKLHFGGCQMIFVGDVYQLPPVVTGAERAVFRGRYPSPYFFDADIFRGGFQVEFIELEKIYRQKDSEFITLLNAIRNNSVTEAQLRTLNLRRDPGFAGAGGNLSIYLTTTNKLAESINELRLTGLPKPLRTYEAQVTGDFDAHALPTSSNLQLKEGAQVMLLNNDSAQRWVNGTIGRINRIKPRRSEYDQIWVTLENGEEVEIAPFTWEMFDYAYNQESGAVVSEPIGTFTQYPLKLAWAVTIHKSQGKTFDRVILDIGRGTFAHGQLYVALSRCTSLEGIILKKPIEKRHVIMDWRVVKFVTQYQYRQSDAALPLEKKIARIKQAIKGKTPLTITYLKSNDEKSERTIEPKRVGEMEYLGKKYIGMEAYCRTRQETRVFRVDRILTMSPAH